MPKSEVLHAFAVQSRVIHALLMREVITRYGREGLGIIWLILEPLLLTLMFTAIWYFIKIDKVYDFPIVTFAFSGFAAMQLWRNGANRASLALAPNTGLLSHRSVTLMDVFFARMLLEWAAATSSFIFLSIIFVISGIIMLPEDISVILGGWLLLAWFSLGLSLVIGGLSALYIDFGKFWRPMNYPLLIISGLFFMVDWLPAQIREYILWVPMVHGNEMIREGFFGSIIKTYGDPAYLMTVNSVLTFIGLALVSFSRSRGG